MGLINRILFATDFSDCAREAERHLKYVAKACHAQVDVVHVVEFQPGMDVDYPINSRYLEYQRQLAGPELDRIVKTLADIGLQATGRLAVGLPSQQIAGLAKELDVDLVVVGTLGKTGAAHVLLGSTAERVIGRAPCPVLAVRGVEPKIGSDRPAVQRILTAVDFSDCSLEALEYGIQLAKDLRAAMTILHVLEPVTYGLDFTLGHSEAQQRSRENWESRLRQLSTLLSGQGLKAEHELRGGLPADSIITCAADLQSDLIVMGTHGRRGVSHLLSGSVAESVLRRAPCPVLAVRSPKFAPGHRRIVPQTAETMSRG
jgi:nucleotide-binding universal stress UspA family protein